MPNVRHPLGHDPAYNLRWLLRAYVAPGSHGPPQEVIRVIECAPHAGGKRTGWHRELLRRDLPAIPPAAIVQDRLRETLRPYLAPALEIAKARCAEIGMPFVNYPDSASNPHGSRV